MTNHISEILDAIEMEKRHFFLIEGNISDTLLYEKEGFDSLLDLIEKRTEKMYPNFILYDVFSGITIVRGNKSEICAALGVRFSSQSGTRDPMREALSSGKKKEGTVENEEWNVALPPEESFQLFHRLFTCQEKINRTIIVINYPEACVPHTANEKKLSVGLQKWSLDENIHRNGHILIMLAKSLDTIDHDIYSNRCSCLYVDRMPKPNEERRIEFLNTLDILPATGKVVGKGTSGLSLKEIERIARDTDFQGLESDEMLLDACFHAKRKILQEEYGDVLEITHPTLGFNAIGGLEKPIAKLKEIARSMREGETSLVPQGIGFYGPPGTGKTLIAKACAKEAGVNFVQARDLKNSLVGESERRKTRFHNALRDLAPLIVFNDEFDQAQVSRGSFDGDSGVSKDYLKKDLEIMSDPELIGKVLFITASNRSDLIDTALKRAGRCDLRIPFPPFEARELEKICHAAFVQFPEMQSKVKNFMPFAEKCMGYNGADMIVIIKRAWEHAARNGKKAIIEDDMEWACGDYIPQKANEVEIALMTLLAFRESSSISLFPNNWEEMHEKYAKILIEHCGTDDLETILSSQGATQSFRR